MIMQNLIFPCVALSVFGLVASAGWAQVPNDCRPAPTNLGHAQYPCIHPDLSVTFRVKAPLAQKVVILPDPSGSANNGTGGLGTGPYEMTKDADGNWSVTTPPARPGLHEYRMMIDGLGVADPNGEVFDILNGRNSAIEVPDPAFDAYLIKDVPHGQVRTVWFFSKIANEWRDSIVYTPPDYDANPTKRYPVLYLQNGGGQDETNWTREGHANFILDNLIAAGKAKPMIIVMNHSVAVRSTAGPNADDEVPQLPTPFERVLLTESIPYIDAHFRTVADRNHRALAGLSGGSGFAFIIGCGHPEVFSYVGVFSRAPYNSNFDLKTIFNGAFTRPDEFNKKIHLLYWNTGTEEPRIYSFAHATTAAMNKMGIKAVLVDEPGFAHEWATWRRALYDFAPRLF
jgi:enterochelin esterase family protein